MDKIADTVFTSIMPEPRKYLETHSWINFDLGNLIEALDQTSWLKLGESFSKCQFLIGASIGPRKAAELSKIYMRKGAWATAQIEGNTLSEKQLDAVLDQEITLPDSQQYLEQEITNVLSALTALEKQIAESNSVDPEHLSNFELTIPWIQSVHKDLLANLSVADHVTPGSFRTESVGVMRYVAAPTEDVIFLMDKYCEWINSLIQTANESGRTKDPIQAFASTIIVAVLAHLYFAWIHPFGDGNGRSARLIECAILAHSNLIPWISTNILSDYYNKTRDLYYKSLESASKNLDVLGFVRYSITGFNEQIRAQVSEVQKFQRSVAWDSYISEKFGAEPITEKSKRQEKLVRALPENTPVTITKLLSSHPLVQATHSSKSTRTLKRDLEDLIGLGLAEEVVKGSYRSNIRIMDGFKPLPELGSH